MFSRFKDKIYIIFMNVLPPALVALRHAVMLFLQTLYGVPIKWEPRGHVVTWGE